MGSMIAARAISPHLKAVLDAFPAGEAWANPTGAPRLELSKAALVDLAELDEAGRRTPVPDDPRNAAKTTFTQGGRNLAVDPIEAAKFIIGAYLSGTNRDVGPYITQVAEQVAEFHPDVAWAIAWDKVYRIQLSSPTGRFEKRLPHMPPSIDEIREYLAYLDKMRFGAARKARAILAIEVAPSPGEIRGVLGAIDRSMDAEREINLMRSILATGNGDVALQRASILRDNIEMFRKAPGSEE